MTNPHHQPGIAAAVRVLAAVAIGTAMLAICGYLVHEAWLISLVPGWQGMSPLTAAGVLMLAVPLQRRRAPRLDTPTRLLSLLTAVVMLAVLGSHAMYHADTISQWLTGAVLGLPATIGGRVSVATAVCLLALSVVATARLGTSRHAGAIVDVASNAALLVAGTALLGYAYRVTDLYGIYVFDSMSLQSALSIACLALANLLASEQTRLGMALRSPSLEVRHLRRMLALPLLPVVLGWPLSKLGGPGAGGNGAALAMLVIASSVPMFICCWKTHAPSPCSTWSALPSAIPNAGSQAICKDNWTPKRQRWPTATAGRLNRWPRPIAQSASKRSHSSPAALRTISITC